MGLELGVNAPSLFHTLSSSCLPPLSYHTFNHCNVYHSIHNWVTINSFFEFRRSGTFSIILCSFVYITFDCLIVWLAMFYSLLWRFRYHEGEELEKSNQKYNFWYKHGLAMLNILNVDLDDVGQYACIANNQLGSCTTVGELNIQGLECFNFSKMKLTVEACSWFCVFILSGNTSWGFIVM